MSNTSVERANPLQQLRANLDNKSADLADLLPRNLPVEKFIRVFMAEAVRNPVLTQCDFLSVYVSLCTAAQLGLMVGSVLGECYLIPYGKTCQAIVGYKGLTKLARRAGVIVRAELVYEGEPFSYERGTGAITHPWMLAVDRHPDRIVAAYAIAELTMHPGMRPIVVVLTRADIEKHREKSAAKNSGPWKDHYGAMARKTAIRALMVGGLVPLEAETAAQLDEEMEERFKPAEVIEAPERVRGVAGLAARLGAEELPECAGDQAGLAGRAAGEVKGA